MWITFICALLVGYCIGYVRGTILMYKEWRSGYKEGYDEASKENPFIQWEEMVNKEDEIKNKRMIN